MLEHKIPWKVLKIWPKIGIYSCFNENMTICEYKRSRSLVDPYSCMLTFLSISSKPSGPAEIRFHVELRGVEKTKICSKHLDHMTDWVFMPVYGKTFKYLLLQNQRTESLETWIIA